MKSLKHSKLLRNYQALQWDRESALYIFSSKTVEIVAKIFQSTHRFYVTRMGLAWAWLLEVLFKHDAHVYTHTYAKNVPVTSREVSRCMALENEPFFLKWERHKQ